jgi:hypothetical protein
MAHADDGNGSQYIGGLSPAAFSVRARGQIPKTLKPCAWAASPRALSWVAMTGSMKVRQAIA